MSRFIKWLWRHISRYNNEKTFDEILLKEWSSFLPILKWENKWFVGKNIEVKFSKDENLENGWAWKSMLSRPHGCYQHQWATKTFGHGSSGRTPRFVWTNWSTSVMDFLWGPTGCLGGCLLSDNSYLSAIFDLQGWLEPQKIWEQRRLKVSHHSYCKVFGQRWK